MVAASEAGADGVTSAGCLMSAVPVFGIIAVGLIAACACARVQAQEVLERWIPRDEVPVAADGVLLDRQNYNELLREVGADQEARAPQVSDLQFEIVEGRGRYRTRVEIVSYSSRWQRVELPMDGGDLELEAIPHENLLVFPRISTVDVFVRGLGKHVISWSRPVVMKSMGRHRTVRIRHGGAPSGHAQIAGRPEYRFPLAREGGEQEFNWRVKATSVANELSQSMSNVYLFGEARLIVESRQVIVAQAGDLPGTLRIGDLPAGVVFDRVMSESLRSWRQEDDALILEVSPCEVLQLQLRATLPVEGEGAIELLTLSLEKAKRRTLRFAFVREAGWLVEPKLPRMSVWETSSFPEAVVRHEGFAGAWLIPQLESPLQVERRRQDAAYRASVVQHAVFRQDFRCLHAYQVNIEPIHGQVTTVTMDLPDGQVLQKVEATLGGAVWEKTETGLRIRLPRPLRPMEFLGIHGFTTSEWSPGESFSLETFGFPEARKVDSRLGLDWSEGWQMRSLPAFEEMSEVTFTQPVKEAIRWPAGTAALQLTLASLVPLSVARTRAYALITPGEVAIHGELELDVRRGQRGELELGWGSEFEFGGEWVERYEDGVLYFPEGVRQRVTLPFTARLVLLALPELAVPSSPSHLTRWFIESEPGIDVRVSSDGFEARAGVIPPTIAGYHPRRRLMGVYETREPGSRLGFTVTSLHPYALAPTVVVDAELNTLVAGDGELWQQVTYQVAHPRSRSLVVAFPNKSEIWSLKVNGFVAKPVRKGDDEVSITLPTPESELATTEVSIAYRSSGAEMVMPPEVLGGIPTLRSESRLFGPDGLVPLSTGETETKPLLRSLADFFSPRLPMVAEAKWQLNRDSTDWKIFRGEQPPEGVPPTFLETERTQILSGPVLKGVADALQLGQRWGVSRAEVIRRLRKGLEVASEPGSDLLTIRMRGRDFEDASAIVNAMSKVYLNYRREREQVRSNHSLETLSRQLKNQADKAEEARLRMLDLAERYRIVDLAAMQNRASASGDPVTGAGTILMANLRDTYQQESAVAQMNLQIENLRGLEGDKMIRSAAMLDIDDPTLQGLWPTYQQYELTLQGLLDSGLGRKHPRVQEVEVQLGKTRAMLESAVENAKKQLETKLSMAQQAMALAQGMEEKKKDVSMDERRKVAEYSAASKEYELQKNMLANMQAKFATEQVELTKPKLPITVHEEAMATPNKAAGILPLDLDLDFPLRAPLDTEVRLGALAPTTLEFRSLRDEIARAWLGIACGGCLLLALCRGDNGAPWFWTVFLFILLGGVTPVALPHAVALANAILLGVLAVGITRAFFSYSRDDA